MPNDHVELATAAGFTAAVATVEKTKEARTDMPAPIISTGSTT